jgi:hypothetical protein
MLAIEAGIFPVNLAANIPHADIGSADTARQVWMGGKAYLLLEGISKGVIRKGGSSGGSTGERVGSGSSTGGGGQQQHRGGG